MHLFDSSIGTGTFVLLLVALFIATAFEFVNGFHDTANAVATVICTRSLHPWKAVILSGTLNLLGVYLGGIAVAMSVPSATSAGWPPRSVWSAIPKSGFSDFPTAKECVEVWVRQKD